MWYNKNEQLIINELKTDIKNGLDKEVAISRLKTNGLNKLNQVKSKNWAVVFLLSFLEPLTLVLIFSGILMTATQFLFNFEVDYIDVIVILLIVVINATIQTIQYVKAKQSLNALQKMIIPQVSVKRSGEIIEIPVTNLVVGDLVLLEAGKFIPADLRIISAQQLFIDESAITGESLPVLKNNKIIKNQDKLILAKQKNMAFMSTFITSGRLEGIVVETGKNTEIGKIAENISSAKNLKTPLQKRLNKLTRLISILALSISLAIFMFLFFTNKAGWPRYIVLSVIIALAIIPESLTVIVSITQSIAVQKMSKFNVIVKKLDALETLGSIDVICTDKTGTLTQNKMAIEQIMINNEVKNQKPYKLNYEKNQDFHFLNSLILCNDAVNDHQKQIGDPTELALINYAQKFKININKTRNKYKRLQEFPFDSKRKIMSTINQIDNKSIMYLKGAVEQIIKNATHIMINNKVVRLTDSHKQQIFKINSDFSKKGLRTIALSFKKVKNSLKPNKKPNEKKLIFLGIVGMIDPLRKDVIQAIEKAKNGGIETYVITGDHREVALTISKKLKIADNIEQVMEGQTIEKTSERKLIKKLENVRVFARVNPEHKTKIVNCLQKKNKVVAMTGDGVNDGPSLANADVGIAMGKSGTDVAKEAAKIILQDDNFATLVKGIEEGRNVLQKIRQAIIFVFASNISQVLVFAIISIFGRLYGDNIQPLDSINVLWFNLVVECLLSITMSLGKNNINTMQQKPFPKNASFFTNARWMMAFLISITTLTVCSVYFIGIYCFANGNFYDADAKIATILTMITCPAIYVYFIKLKTPLSSYSKNHDSQLKNINYYLIGTIILVIFLNSMLVYIEGINDIFISIVKEDGTIASYTPILSFNMSLIAWFFILIPGISLFFYNQLRDKFQQLKFNKIIK